MGRNTSDMKFVTIPGLGGLAMMPSRHVYQFKCQEGAYAFYVVSDGPFDIHYVDAAGKEMTPADALTAVKENAATEMK